jgi:hypothetical protein
VKSVSERYRDQQLTQDQDYLQDKTYIQEFTDENQTRKESPSKNSTPNVTCDAGAMQAKQRDHQMCGFKS